MTPIKDFIAKTFLKKAFHFSCNCLLDLDVKGIVNDYEVIGNEIVLIVSRDDGKIIHIGLNTPSLEIEEI